jgi:type II secretory pathway component PulK
MRPVLTQTKNGNRRARESRSQRGVALVIVMIVIFVLAALAAGFAISMKVETKLAQHADSDTELKWLGRSGIEYARWILSMQASCPIEQYDALSQIWSGGTVGGPCTTNGPLAEVLQEVHLGHGYFTWKMVDMERRMNINSALAPNGEAMLQQALTIMGVDAGQTTPIVGSILDWLDPDDTTHLQGAESDDYRSQTPSYGAKNGPMDDISELLLIKGITWDMYTGAGSENYQASAVQSRLNRFNIPGQAPMYAVALTNLFCTVSSGRININTASAEVLQLFPGVDAMCAEQIVAARSGEDDGSGLTGPYRSVDELRRVPCVTLEMIRLIKENGGDVRSRTFQVEIDAHVGGSSRKFYAIIVRNNPRDLQVINFYWKI